MLKKRCLLLADVVADKRYVVSVRLSLLLHAVKYVGEVLMCQAAHAVIDEQDSYVVGSVCLEQSGCGVRGVIELLSRLKYQFNCLRTYVIVPVQSL